MTAEARLKELGIVLPNVPSPVANYVPFRLAGNLLFLSGQGPRDDKGNALTGKFKGPNQSGSINGGINVHHIEIRSNTNHPVVFRGRVDGDTITGKVHVMGREGEFRAVRQP